MYRYWTGSAWTPYVTANPYSAPPTSTESAYAPPAPKKRQAGWIVGAVAVLVVVGLVGALLIGRVTGAKLPFIDDEGVEPDVGIVECPKPLQETPTLIEGGSVDGRLYGGKLSYAELGSPWSSPSIDDRLAFADLAMEQVVVDQEAYDGTPGHSWVSSVLIAEVYSGDGFGDVQAGAELILECAKGQFYGDTAVTQETLSSGSHPVSGHDGWLIDANIHFSIPGLNASYDHVLFLLVQTGDNQYSVFYSSIPDTSASLNTDAEAALESLTVD
jgi:hypothetical protein